MLNAFVWGFIAAFSLVIGGLIASWMTIGQRTLGLIMAFGEASGSSTLKTLSLWLLIALVSGGASAAGFSLLAGVPETWMAFVQTFAAGAILTMLANSMIPEAYGYSRKLAGLFMVLGFAVAVCVVILERGSAG